MARPEVKKKSKEGQIDCPAETDPAHGQGWGDIPHEAEMNGLFDALAWEVAKPNSVPYVPKSFVDDRVTLSVCVSAGLWMVAWNLKVD